MTLSRTIRLSAAQPGRTLRHLIDRVDAQSLAEGQNPVVTITRAGTFTDPRYGEFTISREMLLSMIRNFDARVYGQDVALDVAHDPNGGAAGWFRRLFLDGNKLRGEVELTAMGLEAIKKRGYRYLSAEFSENYVDNETQQEHGPTLLGAGLVVRPAIKRLDPIELAAYADGDSPVLLSERVTRFLTEEIQTMWKELIKKLQAQLKSFGLADAVATQLVAAFEETAKKLGEDKASADALFAQFEQTGKSLAEAYGSREVPLNISLNAPSQDPDAVSKAVSKQLAEIRAQEQEQARKLAEARGSRVKLFTETIEAAEGLDDSLKKELTEGAEELIAAEMSEDQVRKLAERQIKLGNQFAVSRQLSSMGYEVQGNAHISVDDTNNIKSLQEDILGRLRGSSLHTAGRLHLGEKEGEFVTRVLSEFDRINAPRLHQERKVLSGGTTGIGDTSLPASFQRTVIREALSDLRVLDLVQTLTDFQAQATTQVPYEERDTSALSGDGIVYEGNGIPRASIAQKMDTAYVLPMKLAFLISNEVMHFSRTSQINWDAYARNVESNARVMRELIVRRICNELQRVSDAYLAANVADEDVSAQANGSNSTIKTAEFPIVRPHQQRDLQGNVVGAEENPITVKLNGTAVQRYDGTGSQSAGTYYRVTSYNLGYIQFVDQTGAPVTPTHSAGDTTVSYSRATNVAKFDLDVPSGDTLEKHLNGLLRAIGARKAAMSGDRFVQPNFLLMSPVLNDTCTNAEQFAASAKRNGADTDGQGDLQAVKGVPAWATNAPSVDLGDERILMGERGVGSYVVAKPFMTGQPFEAVNSAGLPTGQKQAYGEEYNAIHTPKPLRQRFSSVLAYSATGR